MTNKERQLLEALEAIVKEEPCYYENGGCFFPRHDADGTYIGDQNADPVDVIKTVMHIAHRALDEYKMVVKPGDAI